MERFHFNFYFFGSLLACLFSIYVTLFFLRLKDRSKAAFHLGLSTLAMALFHLAYIIAFISFDEWTIFHRWLAIPSPMMGFVQCFIFFFYFPDEKKVKFGLYVYYALYAILFVVLAVFVFVTLGSVHRFNIGSSYWDFEVHRFYRIFSLIILVYNFSFLASATWRAIVEKGKERRWIIYIATAYSTITIIPGILNVMSRDGSVSRKVFQHTTDIALVAGLFLVLIVYANATKERTTILSRIISVTMATFFLAFQLLGYAILSSYDSSYDLIKTQSAELAVKDGKTPEGFAYIDSYDPASGKFRLERGEKDPRFSEEDRLELAFFHTANRLASLGKARADLRLKESVGILEAAPTQFYAYAEGLRRFYASRAKDTVSDEEIRSLFRQWNEKSNIIKNRFSNLSSKTDFASVAKVLKSDEPELSLVLDRIRDRVEKGILSGSSEAEIRNIVVSSLSPLREAGERIYRGAKFNRTEEKTPEFYVSYIVLLSGSEKVYEVGFTYRSLRKFIHDPSLVLTICLIIVMFTISFGFRFFFQNAFVRPMEEVVVGLKEVNSGNLEYRLIPRVEDEIGFIARSFNRMARSIQAARRRLERYANDLEEKVKDRTKELEESLLEIRELKQQQDGDYFLTSLLTKALGENRAPQGNVRVDFLLEQKKKFTFRKYEDEIGGDLNISDRILLQNRSYTVFLNGDAMGKSMQGAGGALVLGAVFESIVERSKAIDSVKAQSPERWLKNAFIELHKVFESFNGSMLVSSVTGLVDDETGILYYINAEHPWTILYRDRVASFIETDFMFRKLGTTGLDGSIYVRTFQLKEGDVIIVGSDGRDDIVVGTDSEGDRIINDDENMFLRTVEEAEGDLEKIRQITLKKGQLSDDLSLIRLAYKSDPSISKAKIGSLKRIKELLRSARESSRNADAQEALAYLQEAEALDGHIPEVKRDFVRVFLRLKDYSKAARYAEDYIKIKPIDNDLLYVASFAARKSGELRKALDFGERLRLRDPNHFKNNLNLARIYISFRNYEAAMNLLRSAAILEPENESVQRSIAALRKYWDESA